MKKTVQIFIVVISFCPPCFAQEKQVLIDETKHCILKAAHPSPFSAHSGFFGCRHFSKTNEYLVSNGVDPVDWKL